MGYISIRVQDPLGNDKGIIEVPDDVPVNRILVILIEKLKMPKYAPDGGLLSYKFHHQATKRQLLDNETLKDAGVKEGDILRLQPEITAGGEGKLNTIDFSLSYLKKDERFARFKLINWWDQEKLYKAKTLVIGAGALGNEILKNLALLGIGKVFIVDFDVIENSNLSRSVLFRESDEGRRKAEVAARAVKNIYPHINVHWFDGDIVYDLGLGIYRWVDIVIAGVDNREARLSINRNCWKTNTPWIDGAIEQLDGVVRVFIPPDGACYECTMSKTDWEILKMRRSCNLLSREEMLSGKIPTTPTSASIIAAIQCQEAVKLLHGLEVIKSRGFIFHGLTCESYIVEYSRKDDCLSHETYSPIRKINKSVRNTCLGDLLEEVKSELGKDAIIEFNTEILYSLECPHCKENEIVLKSLGKITEKKGICPFCGTMRKVNTLHSINGNERFLDKTFYDIGIPLWDIVVGRKGMTQIFLEFNGDAKEVLGPLYQEEEE